MAGSVEPVLELIDSPIHLVSLLPVSNKLFALECLVGHVGQREIVNVIYSNDECFILIDVVNKHLLQRFLATYVHCYWKLIANCSLLVHVYLRGLNFLVEARSDCEVYSHFDMTLAI